MARPKSARGFTLVELLVVITIIGMLVSLLLPAIQSAHEAGRRTTCMNNMRQVATGLTLFEGANKGFPGYANHTPAKTLGIPAAGSLPKGLITSWVVPILPSLEQNVLYQNWMNPNLPVNWVPNTTNDNTSQYIVELPILRCPSNANPNLNPDAMSFVVNTGSAWKANDNDPVVYPPGTSATSGPNWPEDPASGVMFNQSGYDYPDEPVRRVNMDYVSANDGSTNTLMVTENLQSAGWATQPDTTQFFQYAFEVRQATGIVWFFTGNSENTDVINAVMSLGTNYVPAAANINGLGQDISGTLQHTWNPMDASQPTGLAYARPSAYHPGGVNAMFCGSNARFLADTIDYKVYTQLMSPRHTQVVVDYNGTTPIRANYRGPMNTWTPQGAQANPQSQKSGGTKTALIPVPWGYVLDEGDL